jgi:hypothetical protein
MTPMPSGWTAQVNRAENERELVSPRRSVARGGPFGDDLWQQRTACARAVGPRKEPNKQT